MNEEKQVIARNKKAYHDYFVLETYEAGIELFGTEIKSIRAGKVNLKDSFCSVDDGEYFRTEGRETAGNSEFADRDRARNAGSA